VNQRVTGHRGLSPIARVRARPRVGTVTWSDVEEVEEALIHAIEGLFNAEELGEEEWAEYKRTHRVVTWDFRSCGG
jgi:hypothetical protein